MGRVYEVNNEKELHTLIERSIGSYEEGIKILQHEYDCAQNGIADFLYVDSGNRLGIMEVKKDSDDNILFQSLWYYDWVNRNRYAIKALFEKESSIDATQEPRITLVAKTFSESVKRFAQLVKPDVELVEYSAYRCDCYKIGLVFKPVIIPPAGDIRVGAPPSEEDLVGYMTDERAREALMEAIGCIQRVDSRLNKYNTTGYIGYMFKGKGVAFITPRRRFFTIDVPRYDDNRRRLDSWVSVTVTTGEEDLYEALSTLKASVRTLDG